MNLVLTAILIGNLTMTSYRSVPEQTDSTPFITSIGERVSVRGCAVSRDLLKQNGGPISYGDLIYIEGIGYKFVNDCMGDDMCIEWKLIEGKRKCVKRMKIRNWVDIWVPTKDAEKAFFKKWRNGKTRVFLIKTSLGG